MRHLIDHGPSQLKVEYQCKFNGLWQKIGVQCQGEPQSIIQGSEIEFITDHYWGYSVQANGETLAYQVEHPPWNVWKADTYEMSLDVKNLYGSSFIQFLEHPPISSFLADGSHVKVFAGITI